MKKRTLNLSISVSIALAIILVLVSLHAIVPEESIIHRLTCLMGGCLPNGFIQGLTYCLFAFGILELRDATKSLNLENKAFESNLEILEDSEIAVSNLQTLESVFAKAYKKTGHRLSDLLKNACAIFANNRSSAETINAISTMTAVQNKKVDSSQSIIRYVIWAIPSIGFIGTVIGISTSLGAAHMVNTEDGLAVITGLLNIAFDTTLVALVLSLILVYLFHKVDEQLENQNADIEHFVINNLINKLQIK